MVITFTKFLSKLNNLTDLTNDVSFWTIFQKTWRDYWLRCHKNQYDVVAIYSIKWFSLMTCYKERFLLKHPAPSNWSWVRNDIYFIKLFSFMTWYMEWFLLKHPASSNWSWFRNDIYLIKLFNFMTCNMEWFLLKHPASSNWSWFQNERLNRPYHFVMKMMIQCKKMAVFHHCNIQFYHCIYQYDAQVHHIHIRRGNWEEYTWC